MTVNFLAGKFLAGKFWREISNVKYHNKYSKSCILDSRNEIVVDSTCCFFVYFCHYVVCSKINCFLLHLISKIKDNTVFLFMGN